MTIRFRAASAASMALVLGLSMAAAGCGKYSWSTLSAVKSFKDGNALYRRRTGSERPRSTRPSSPTKTPQQFPQLATAYFFLGNSYDQLYKPAKPGDPRTTPTSRRPSTTTEGGPRERRPGMEEARPCSTSSAAYGSDKLNDPVKAEPVYQEIIALEPKEPGNYMALAKLYEEAGRYDDAEAQYTKAREVKPNDPSVLAGKAGYYNRQGDFPKTIAALEQAAALEPNNPEGYHRVAVFYWDKSRGDFRLSPAEKSDFIRRGSPWRTRRSASTRITWKR